MSKKVLVLTDLEGALISSRRPEVEGRRYMVVTRSKWDKKAMTHENMDRLKELEKVADIVPMTKLNAKKCCGMAFCVTIPMSLVESGAMLMKGNVPDYKWRLESLGIVYPDNELLYEGIKFLNHKGYEQNNDNEFTLDYVLPGVQDISDDVEELRKLIGSRYNVYKAGSNRVYAYHSELGRRKMIGKFLDRFSYDKVISICAVNTGWIQERGTSISVEGMGADFEYPKDLYEKDLHMFTAFALDKALEIART